MDRKPKTGVGGKKIWEDARLKSERVRLEMRLFKAEPCRLMGKGKWVPRATAESGLLELRGLVQTLLDSHNKLMNQWVCGPIDRITHVDMGKNKNRETFSHIIVPRKSPKTCPQKPFFPSLLSKLLVQSDNVPYH